MPPAKPLSTQVNDFTSLRNVVSAAPDVLAFEGNSKCLIDPYSSAMQFWDVMLVLGLAYTSIVTPFDAAFLDLSVGEAIFFLNLAVDVVFLIDIFVTFRLPYADPVTGIWVRDSGKIARRYLRGWFVIDVVSVFPFDWIILAAHSENVDPQALRSLRLLKLLKIARIMRGNRIYKRWRDRIGLNLTWMAMWFYILFTLLMAHWIACILGVIPSIEGSTYEDLTDEQILAGEVAFNWQTEYFETNLGFPPGSYGLWTVYLGSLYWSVMTLTTIGFGDVAPKTNVERAFMSVLMFVGASLQAYLIGTVCGLVAELAESSTNFRKEVNALNEFMRAYDFPDELRVRLRKFFAYKHSAKDTNRYAELIDQLSPALQTETSVIVNAVWVQQVPFIEMAILSERDDLVVSLSRILDIEIFAPFERVQSIGEPVTKLYIISKGLVVLHMSSDPLEQAHDQLEVGNMNVRLSVAETIRSELIRGQCFGHELIFANVTSLYNCTTIQFSELHVLTKEQLDTVLVKFPSSKQAIDDYTRRKAAEY